MSCGGHEANEGPDRIARVSLRYVGKSAQTDEIAPPIVELGPVARERRPSVSTIYRGQKGDCCLGVKREVVLRHDV